VSMPILIPRATQSSQLGAGKIDVGEYC
jgi:hypothetical protein